MGGCAESSTNPATSEEPLSAAGYDESQIADFTAALGSWNTSGDKWRTAMVQNRGTTRCGIGYNAAFPELALVTVINTDGRWFQVSIHPSAGVKDETIRSGPDYQLALGDTSPEEFFAVFEPCSVSRDGSVTLSTTP